MPQLDPQILGAIPDDGDHLDVDPEVAQLLGQPRAVAVGDDPGQHLGAGHEDPCAHLGAASEHRRVGHPQVGAGVSELT